MRNACLQFVYRILVFKWSIVCLIDFITFQSPINARTIATSTKLSLCVSDNNSLEFLCEFLNTV